VATQTVAFPNDHQHAGDDPTVRHSSTAHKSSDGLQRPKELRTNHSCLHDPDRIIGICAAVEVVLDFIRTADLGDLALPFRDGPEHLETRAALESAVGGLELLKKAALQGESRPTR
jgi:hypothetical protein